MSGQATEQTGQPEVVEIPMGDAAFGALMDALAPEDDPKAAQGAAAAPPAGGAVAPAEAPGAGAGEAGAPAAGTAAAADTGGAGAAAPAVPAAGTDAGGAAAPEGGTAGAGAAPAAGDGAAAAGAGAAGSDAGSGPAADGGRPASWTAAAADLIPKLGEISTKFEERTAAAYHEQALTEVKEKHAKYFEAIQKPARTLVGMQVPRADGKDGNETLRSTEDARDWQEAVKQVLVEEVRGRAAKAMEDNSDFLDTVHASIELFQNNVDLVPNTKEFDVELANRFAALATPYELRVEGKLHGYSIPVQPIINQLRTQLAAERAAKVATPAAPAAPAATGAPAPASTPGAGAPPADPPQVGIESKAGGGDQPEDFSTLFGTLGLPNIRI